MTKMHPDFIGNPVFAPGKSEKCRPQKEKSFVVFILSVLVYISTIYIFNLSFCSLLKNPRFWFFISNTLILIIYTDYGAFSEQENYNLYDDYVARSTQSRSSPVFVSQYPEIARNTNPNSPAEEIKNPKEVTKGIIYQPSDQVPEKIIQVVSENENAKKMDREVTCAASKRIHRRSKSNVTQSLTNEACGARKVTGAITHGRSKSDKVTDVAIRESEIREEDGVIEEESDEFSEMSNEELNKRVEEFIERFNRQIRLQGLRSRRILAN